MEPLLLPPNPELTPWITVQEYDARKHWFRRADLIEFERGMWFNHWGLCLENGLVVHVTSYDLANTSRWLIGASTAAVAVSPRTSSRSVVALGLVAAEQVVALGGRYFGASDPDVGRREGEHGTYFVRVDHIQDIAGDKKFRVNNVACGNVAVGRRSWPDIFDMVMRFKDAPFSYDLIRRNCEHFATFLRNNSGQNQAQGAAG